MRYRTRLARFWVGPSSADNAREFQAKLVEVQTAFARNHAVDRLSNNPEHESNAHISLVSTTSPSP